MTTQQNAQQAEDVGGTFIQRLTLEVEVAVTDDDRKGWQGVSREALQAHIQAEAARFIGPRVMRTASRWTIQTGPSGSDFVYDSPDERRSLGDAERSDEPLRLSLSNLRSGLQKEASE